MADPRSEGGKTGQNNATEIDPERNLTSNATTMMSGFIIKWYLANAQINMNNEALEWKKMSRHASYVREVNIMSIFNLVRESKVQRVDEGEVWKTLLKNR